MRSKTMFATFAVATSILGTAGVAAQPGTEAEIDFDRPGIAEGAGVVAKGRVQVEAGFQRETRNEADQRVRTLSIPTLLRVGAADRVELRIEGDTYTREKTSAPGAPTERSEGVAPTSVGAKVRLSDRLAGSGGWVAAIVRFFPRSGSSNFRTAHATGDIRVVGEWDIAPKWSFNPNVGIGVYEDESQRRYTTALLAASLTYEASDSLSLFIDSGAQSREERNGKASAIIDVGATYLVGRNTQLDFSVGRRVAGHTSPERFVSAGLSRRF